jgi:pyruvate dehydrogenase E2 component (dihydrolipoamide acetyltransferase)
MAVKATPRARARAAAQGIDLARVKPTGPGGRILERDVLAAAKAQFVAPTPVPVVDSAKPVKDNFFAEPANDNFLPEPEPELIPETAVAPEPETPETEVVLESEPETIPEPEVPYEPEPVAEFPALAPADPMQEPELPTLAPAEPVPEPPPLRPPMPDVGMSFPGLTRLSPSGGESGETAAASGARITHHHVFDATGIFAMVDSFETSEIDLGLKGVTATDILLFVLSRTLTRHPEINAFLIDGRVFGSESVDLGLTMKTPTGARTPVVFGAEKRSLNALSAEVRGLKRACATGSLDEQSLMPSTFTVVDLSDTGVMFFTPALAGDQTAVLGVCASRTLVRPDGQRLSAYQGIGLSLSCDPGIVSNIAASAFLCDLCDQLETFSWEALYKDSVKQR